MTEKQKMLYKEYEATYVGHRKSIPSVYFKDLSKEQKQEQALDIIRYSIKHYLKWRPEDVKKYITTDILRKLKLKTLYDDYVVFPQEYSKESDVTYLAYLLYPNKFHVNMKEQCINMFKRVYAGEASRYPTTWINSLTGIERFSIVFQYAVSQRATRFKSVEEMYQFFAGKEGPRFMQEYKIHSFAKTLYSSDFEAMHYALPSSLKNDFLYEYHSFLRKSRVSIPPSLRLRTTKFQEAKAM